MSICLFTGALFVSCGQRGEESEYDNVFSGKWRVEAINCFNDSSSIPAEIYELDSSIADVIYYFDGRSFTYSAQINATPGCQVNATGLRNVGHYNDSTGQVSFAAVSNHTSCATEIDERNNQAMDVLVPFGINEAAAQNLEWKLDSSLVFENPAVFKGSPFGPCSGSCVCFSQLQRD